MSPQAARILQQLAVQDNFPRKAFPGQEGRPPLPAYTVAAAAVVLSNVVKMQPAPAKARPQPELRPEGIHHANTAVPAAAAPRANVDQTATRQHQAKAPPVPKPKPKPTGPPPQPVVRHVAVMQHDNEMFDMLAGETAKREEKKCTTSMTVLASLT